MIILAIIAIEFSDSFQNKYAVSKKKDFYTSFEILVGVDNLAMSKPVKI